MRKKLSKPSCQPLKYSRLNYFSTTFTINEVLASSLSKVFNHQVVGTDTIKYRLMILPYGVSLL